jgi:hypothetical protein
VRYSYLLLLLPVALVSSCGSDRGEIAQQRVASTAAVRTETVAVTIDLSTPDRALRSYWKAKDDLRRKEHAVWFKARRQHSFDLGTLLTADAQTNYEHLQKADTPVTEYNRDIIDVKQETESRAVIIAHVKNATPFPPGAVLTEKNEKRRAEGERIRYVLEKTSAGWKVSQAYRFSEYRSKYENKDPWEPLFSRPDPADAVPVFVNAYEN